MAVTSRFVGLPPEVADPDPQALAIPREEAGQRPGPHRQVDVLTVREGGTQLLFGGRLEVAEFDVQQTLHVLPRRRHGTTPLTPDLWRTDM